jgi:uncharacterized membrane protein
MPTLESAFQLLFKYRPAVFAEGDLAFGVGGSGAWLALGLIAAALAIGAALLTYRSVGARSSMRDRVALGALRVAILLVVLVCLFRPMLLLSSPVPQRNFVGVLVDDSRSMRIADGGNERASVIRAALGTRDSALVAALRERFQVRLFRFGSAVHRLEDVTSLGFDAAETRLGDAISRARQELDAVPLSGLVVLSDGADNTEQSIATELASLRARAVPVYTVGIGADRFDRDIEVDRVELPRQVLVGSAFVATVVIRQRGYGGERVPLVVEDEGRVIAREEIELPPDGAASPVRVPVTVRDAGARTLRFHVPLQSREQVSQNNDRRVLLEVRHTREKVLYVEGEPRYEVRFVREAVEADSNLQLVVLQRTAENKFLRLNVDGPAELAGGFPATRAELFRYRAIILGSIEASAFTQDQLRMLADFVSVRGGGMLFLGGRRAFAEGGYAGTPLADVLPVYVEGDAVPDSLTQLVTLTARVTPAGATHPVTQHAATARGERGSESAIVRVPVTSVNRVSRLKPGAVSLLEGSESDSRQRLPVLAYQRFGRGLAVAMPIQDSYLWYMAADVPVEDVAHRTLWRRLLRWLTSDTPDQLRVSTSADRVRPGGQVTIRAELADSSFVRRNDAKVTARVRSPSGVEQEIALEWVVDRDGEYEGRYSSEELGIHAVTVVATAAQRAAHTIEDSTHVAVADLGAEFYGAEMRRPLLSRIADETGGRFYTPETMRTLPEDIAMSKAGVTVVQQMDLWDMPAVLLLLVVLLSAEWAYRRRRGLA